METQHPDGLMELSLEESILQIIYHVEKVMTEFVEDIFGGISFIIGIASLVYAIYVQRQASKLRKYQIGKLRNCLKDCIIIMSQSFRLLRDTEKYGILDKEAIKKVSCIHSISATLIRSLFHELSEIDLPYDENRLKNYVSSGLITSQWVWEQAVTFVKDANGISIPDLPADTKDYVE